MASVDGRKDIENFIRKCLESLESGALALDAGAGDPMYQVRVPNRRYVTVDLGVGDKNWDYNKLDVCANLEAVPFADNSFDAVIISQVMEHLREPQKVLDELCRVLKTNGKIFLTAPQEWVMHQTPHDYFRFTRYGLAYILEKAGFHVESIQPIGGFYRSLALKLVSLHTVLFPQENRYLVRLLRRPLMLLSRALFHAFFPWLLEKMDRFDKTQLSTIGYTVVGIKK